jgi:4-hydroxy-tetrahydrodipicolinate synthase
MPPTELRGVYPVVSTPFCDDGTVDHGGIERIIHAQIERNIHGVVLFGIAAEFYKLEDEERRRIIETAKDVVDGTDIDLVVSVTDHATDRAEWFARFAEQNGAKALMLLPPYFLGPGAEDLQRHMRRVGKAVDIPVMVQYAPDQTGVSMSPETFVALSEEVETIRYFKIESRPPGPDISRIVDAASERVGVLIGYAGLQMIEALDRGAVGVIPGASISNHYLEVWERYEAGDREGARRKHAAMLPLIAHVVQDIEGFIHYEKRMLADMGLIDSVRARKPAFTPDEHFDLLFEEYYRELGHGGV